MNAFEKASTVSKPQLKAISVTDMFSFMSCSADMDKRLKRIYSPTEYPVTALKKIENEDDAPTYTLIPAFVITELKTAFKIGFIIFLPFLVIDIVVASILVSMGMLFLPPATVATPFKLILFVMIDGWFLVTKTLLEGFIT